MVASAEKKAVSIIGSVCSKNKLESAGKIAALENILLTLDQADIPVTHRFSGGIYSREITIKKGTLLTGRIHKFDHFDIMLSGDITVSTDSGEVKRMTGLNIMDGKAGKKRAGFAHEDTHWITFHSAEERNPEEMYSFLTCENFAELSDFNKIISNDDYSMMIDELGMSEEQVRAEVEITADIIKLGVNYLHLYTEPSTIEGLGLFSSLPFNAGTVIAPARISNSRTIAGRYTNHAFTPNSKMVVTGDGVDLVAIRDISEDEEITVNYRDVISERVERGDL